jgi:hypothetical protein
LWRPDGLEKRRPAEHIAAMASGLWTNEFFNCPDCGMEYAATKEQHSDKHSGSFNCQICSGEVHAWSGPHDFFDWKMMKTDSPVFGKKK